MFSRRSIGLVRHSSNRHPPVPVGQAAGLRHEPALGTHLVASRRGYTHHGIYVGGGMVVHYAGLSGLLELHRALSIYGLGDHPVIATLTGVFENNNYDEILHRHYPVLKIIDAIDIKISQAVERPY